MIVGQYINRTPLPFAPALQRYQQLNAAQALPPPPVPSTPTPPRISFPAGSISYPQENLPVTSESGEQPEDIYRDVEEFLYGADQQEAARVEILPGNDEPVTNEVTRYSPPPPSYSSHTSERRESASEEEIPDLESAEEVPEIESAESKEEDFVLTGVSMANGSRTRIKVEHTRDRDISKILREIFKIIAERNKTAKRRMLQN